MLSLVNTNLRKRNWLLFRLDGNMYLKGRSKNYMVKKEMYQSRHHKGINFKFLISDTM